jgi:proline racemase
VLFIEVSGCLPMCGHGTIGVATVLGRDRHGGGVGARRPSVRLDTPAGLVEARVAVEGGRARSVTIRNVPSFLVATDREVDVPGYGRIRYDMAFGGNFYAILRARGRGLAGETRRARASCSTPGSRSSRDRRGGRVRSIEDARISGCAHVVACTAPARDGADARAATRSIPAGSTARRAGRAPRRGSRSSTAAGCSASATASCTSR